MTKTERRLLLAIAKMLLNSDRNRDELEAAVKAFLADKSEVK